MAKRTTMNVSLPAPVRRWIADRVSEGGYGSTSEYVRELVRKDQVAAERRRIDDLLVEAIEAGPSEPMTRDDWNAIRAEVSRRSARAKRRRG
jgi:antitoxin ParD1/3/4